MLALGYDEYGALTPSRSFQATDWHFLLYTVTQGGDWGSTVSVLPPTSGGILTIPSDDRFAV
jgi:hypothetical protein